MTYPRTSAPPALQCWICSPTEVVGWHVARRQFAEIVLQQEQVRVIISQGGPSGRQMPQRLVSLPKQKAR